VRAFIERLLEEELEAALGRGRYARGLAARGHRNGHRERRLDTTFGPLVLAVRGRGSRVTMRASASGRASCCRPTGA
jgi:transposase-like protein